MSTSKDYIPKNAKDFNDFQVFLVARVTASGAVWNIPAANSALLGVKSTDFLPINAAISNVETRSRQQVLAYKTYRIGYDTFLREFCQSFLTNNMLIPIDERKAMGLNPRGINPPSKRPKISTAPIVSVKSAGGGEIKFGFKVDESNKRTARHPLSNGVNVFFRIVSLYGAVPPPPPPPVTPVVVPSGNGGNSEPSNSSSTDAVSLGLPSSDGFEQTFSTKAAFTRQLPLADIGKVMYVYAQWVNTSDPSSNSTFSMVTTIVIS
ncbi:MAG: hypothetical protein K9G41_12765 [Flavobacteriales bacterium]|nr:hypothetical protein [Flavobacteriales bacterium]